MSEITLQEQIEAVERALPQRIWPSDKPALKAATATLRAVELHNKECLRICGEGDQEGVRCKYRPYFPRHCPECSRNWMIET